MQTSLRVFLDQHLKSGQVPCRMHSMHLLERMLCLWIGIYNEWDPLYPDLSPKDIPQLLKLRSLPLRLLHLHQSEHLPELFVIGSQILPQWQMCGLRRVLWKLQGNSWEMSFGMHIMLFFGLVHFLPLNFYSQLWILCLSSENLPCWS